MLEKASWENEAGKEQGMMRTTVLDRVIRKLSSEESVIIYHAHRTTMVCAMYTIFVT